MITASHTLAVYGREARAEILTMLRTPQFLAPSVALPVMFFALFGVAFAHGHVGAAQWLLATYAVFASIAPAMFGFGVGVASEREAKLLELKRASPMPSGVYVVGRLAAAMATASIAISLIFIVAAAAGVRMPFWRWAGIFALGAGSSVPFALIGLNLGLRLGAQGASASANLLFVAFSMLGGLWVPLTEMPHWMTTLAWALPSYHLGALALNIAGLTPATDLWAHIGVVVAISVAAAGGAWLGWRREDA